MRQHKISTEKGTGSAQKKEIEDKSFTYLPSHSTQNPFHLLLTSPSSPSAMPVVPVIVVKIRGYEEPEPAAGMPQSPIAPAFIVVVVLTSVIAVAVVVITAIGTGNVLVGDHSHPTGCPEIGG